ncbi:MAG TPA: DUF1015 domain-containing protein [Streptosporangiaceae bacterium]|nr:DUF1015 domain-containing protein [Streptosporangiaceae bacterium]
MQILPSSPEPPAAEPAGLALTPFRGVRYARERVSGLAEVTSPPYDVIAHDIEAQLIAADPHNVVRLILPQHAPGDQGDVYDTAAATLRAWQDGQILRTDPEPALYVYEQAHVGEQAAVVVQRGLIGAVRLSPPEAGVVRPHEDVAPGPVAGRLQLMEATEANLEPIFLLHDGSTPGAATGGSGGVVPPRPAATRLVDETATGRPPLVDAVTRDGIRHRLWAITDPAALDAIAADLAPRTALIADGHHRYAAYLRLQALRRAAGDGDGPWDYGLALLVDATAYPPDIGAIHRVIPGLAPARAVELARTAFTVRSLPGGTLRLDAALDRLADASRQGPAFLVAGGGQVHLLTDPDPRRAEAAMPPGRSPHWRALAASVLQELLLSDVWGVKDTEQAVRIVHHDAAAAVAEADEAGGTAVICSPMSTWDVYEVAAQGERVPRKSTSFGPKPRTGLVIRTFAHG